MLRIAILLPFLLTACASPWEPLYDPRASKEPKEIIRDKMECERLIKSADKYGGVPLMERDDFEFLGIKFCWTDCGKGSRYTHASLPYNYNPMAKCLSNRGHSIINW